MARNAALLANTVPDGSQTGVWRRTPNGEAARILLFGSNPPAVSVTDPIVIGLILAAMMGTCVLLFAQSPDTKVLDGRQIPKRHVEQIRSLGILDPDERIDYFYSDAMFDIEDGFYFLTDRRVVIYSRTFDEPAILVPYEEIEEVEGEFSDNWMQDSYVLLTLKNGSGASFPVSSEAGGDRRVFDALRKRLEQTDEP